MATCAHLGMDALQVKDLTDGRYLISFTPEESGEYVVSALVNGDEIPPDQELQATVLTPPLTVDMCALYVPDQAKVVPAGSSFYVTVGPPESCESKPEDGAKCLVHLQDPNNGITLFPAPWDAQQVAFVADVFVGVVGGNILWATVDVRAPRMHACVLLAALIGESRWSPAKFGCVLCAVHHRVGVHCRPTAAESCGHACAMGLVQ